MCARRALRAAEALEFRRRSTSAEGTSKRCRRARALRAAAACTQIETLEGRLLMSISAAAQPVAVIEGSAFNGAVTTFTDTDVSPIGDYTANIDWGDGTTTAASSITSSSGTFTVNGTHTYADDGSYSVTTSITEDNGADQDTASPVGTATVGESVLSASAMNISAVEGESFSGDVSSFQDPGSPAPVSDYTANINWGDGSALTAGTISGGSGNFTVSGTHTYAKHGTFNVIVTSFDNDDPDFTISVSGTAHVAEGVSLTVTGPAQQVTEGGMLVYPVSVHNGGTSDATDVMFTDVLPDNAGFSFASFTQGGPFSPSGQTITGNLGTIPAGATVNGTIVAQALEEGFFKNTASITSVAGVTLTDESATVFTTVIDAPLTPTSAGKSISATKGKSFTETLGSFADTDPNADPSDYSVTINWGDGTSSAGTIVLDGTGFDVVGTHVYAAAGNNLPIAVIVQDVGGSTATLNDVANVADVPPPPPSGTVSIITDPCDSTKKALKIVGTSGNDSIAVAQNGTGQGSAKVTINGVNKGTFNFTGTIQIYGEVGNDNISVASGITRSAWIWGNDGKDTASGGGGNDFIFGNASDDSLNGNNGRDILIGGDGTDKLNGGSGDDVLIAGDFKTTPTVSQLCSVLKEWTRTDKSYSLRTAHLQNGGGYNTIKLNATTLFSSATLKDSLSGGSNSDLFYASVPGDVITDKVSGETVVDIG